MLKEPAKKENTIVFSTKAIPTDQSDLSRMPAQTPPSSPESMELQTMYQELEKIDRPKPEGTLSRPLLSSILGLIAGFVGALVVTADVGGLMTKTIGANLGEQGTKTVVIERREKVNVPWQEAKDTVFSRVQKNIFSVYWMKAPVADTKSTNKQKGVPIEQAADFFYYPEHQAGVAVALSSDGWLLTTTEVIADDKLPYGVQVDRIVYPIQKTIRDPFSSFLVIKIAVDRLSPAAFADALPEVGSLMLSVSRTGTIFQGAPVFVASIEQYQPLTPKRSVSSEKLETAFRISGSESLLPGSAILTPGGELTGLFNKQTNEVIPAAFVQNKLKDIFKEKKIVRPSLGITYTPLSRVGVDTNTTDPSILEEGLRVDHVVAKGPADKAGLAVGDIITKMENESIDSETNFSQELQSYAPGTKLSFDVLRNLERIKITVTLEAFKP